MTSIFQTQFKIDFELQKVFVECNFNAPLDLVWSAWTEKEILDEWWAPKPFKSKSKYMNFVNGGKRFSAMISPEGMERWMMQEYSEINPKTFFKSYNAFSDENENLNLPGSDWSYSFNEENGVTKVCIEIYNESLERMKMAVEMGFQGGFAMAHNNLDEVLKTLK